MRVRDAVPAHQRIVGQPDHAAGHPRRTADQGLLLDDQRLESGIERRKGGHHSAPAASCDEQVDRPVPVGHRTSDPTRSDSPRSAMGTSMVVFVFWIAPTSCSYGTPARKPSMTLSKLEISPST